MNKQSRLANRIDDLERDYRCVLVKALRECAQGRWGLFGQNDHTGYSNTPTELDDLRSLAASIDNLRDRLALPPFELHKELESARGRAGENEPGEPKLARIWLTKLSD